jgi:hypothetical protein
MVIASHSKANQSKEWRWKSKIFHYIKSNYLLLHFMFHKDEITNKIMWYQYTNVTCLMFLCPIDLTNSNYIANKWPTKWEVIQDSCFLLINGQHIIKIINVHWFLFDFFTFGILNQFGCENDIINVCLKNYRAYLHWMGFQRDLHKLCNISNYC